MREVCSAMKFNFKELIMKSWTSGYKDCEHKERQFSLDLALWSVQACQGFGGTLTVALNLEKVQMYFWSAFHLCLYILSSLVQNIQKINSHAQVPTHMMENTCRYIMREHIEVDI